MTQAASRCSRWKHVAHQRRLYSRRRVNTTGCRCEEETCVGCFDSAETSSLNLGGGGETIDYCMSYLSATVEWFHVIWIRLSTLKLSSLRDRSFITDGGFNKWRETLVLDQFPPGRRWTLSNPFKQQPTTESIGLCLKIHPRDQCLAHAHLIFDSCVDRLSDYTPTNL